MGNFSLRFEPLYPAAEEWMSAATAHYERYKLASGECRPFSLDMDIEFRALRSLAFEQLDLGEITQIHHYEQERLWRRFILPSEVKRLLSRGDYYGARCSQEQLSWLIEFCAKHKPDPNAPEIAHDGMSLHHHWDLAVWHQDFELPLNRDEERSDQLKMLKKRL